jgi:hypothetical protein
LQWRRGNGGAAIAMAVVARDGAMMILFSGAEFTKCCLFVFVCCVFLLVVS